jgi:alpha-amylase
VKKSIRYRDGDSHYTVDYELENGEKTPIELWFGVEFNIGLLAGDAHDRYYEIEGRSLADCRLRSIGEERDVQSFKLVDEWLGIETRFKSDRPATLWRFPIETVSLSEAGLERLYQSSMVTLHWKINLTGSFRVSIEQVVQDLTGKRQPQTKRRKKRSGS